MWGAWHKTRGPRSQRQSSEPTHGHATVTVIVTLLFALWLFLVCRLCLALVTYCSFLDQVLALAPARRQPPHDIREITGCSRVVF